MEIPVYLFTGFIDSGKTSLLNETLFENDFTDDLDNFLVIQCEEGDESIDRDRLQKLGGSLVVLSSQEEISPENLKKLDEEYSPQSVFIEYNGTWPVEPFFEMDGPADWVIAQTLCTVDSTTFLMYMQNMRQMMAESMKRADVIIFNRFGEEHSKAKFRANVKAINRPAQIAYERPDHSMDESEEELPFDLTKEELDIGDADYALWFTDCMDHPEKYDGKIVTFTALVYNPKTGKGKLKSNNIVPGRFAMTCCVEDIQFLGLKCIYKDAAKIEHKSWIRITARVKKEFAKEYGGDGPVLYPITIEEAEKPEDELVYFN